MAETTTICCIKKCPTTAQHREAGSQMTTFSPTPPYTDFVFRYTKERPQGRLFETLDVIKYICKDFWSEIWKKQVDNLKTNHRAGLTHFIWHQRAIPYILNPTRLQQLDSNSNSTPTSIHVFAISIFALGMINYDACCSLAIPRGSFALACVPHMLCLIPLRRYCCREPMCSKTSSSGG